MISHRSYNHFGKTLVDGDWYLLVVGCFEFQFGTMEDKMKVWSIGTYYFQPGMLWLLKWDPDFYPYAQKQSHIQLRIRITDIPQEYWLPWTLFQISSGVCTPLLIDEATIKWAFGHYARILVDVDLSKIIFY